jgi:elongation factor 1-gamma
VVAKANNLKVDLVDTNPGVNGVSEDYRKLNRLGRIPTFEGSDGYILSETIAIAVYRTSFPLPTPPSSTMNNLHSISVIPV